jgi:NADH-quinone oxidoreductase subunit N
MYLKDPEDDFAWVKINVPTAISIAISVVGVLYLGIVPGAVMNLAKLAGF